MRVEIFCVFCHQEVCMEHADPRAVAQQTCQTCLSRAEDSSSEEEYEMDEDDEDGMMNDYEDEDEDEIHERILPEWMRPSRFSRMDASSIYTPSYCPEMPPPPPPPPLPQVKVDISIRDSCSICLESFTKDEHVARLPCHISHMFHTSCIDTWLNVGRGCPLCKKT
jgi:hypothetical protein